MRDIEYYDNGNKSFEKEIRYYDNGNKSFEKEVSYYDNGNKSFEKEIHYNIDEIERRKVEKTYSSNGIIESKIEVSQRRITEEKFCLNNGIPEINKSIIMAEIKYEEKYYPNGNLQLKREYRDGKVYKVRSYNEDGTENKLSVGYNIGKVVAKGVFKVGVGIVGGILKSAENNNRRR